MKHYLYKYSLVILSLLFLSIDNLWGSGNINYYISITANVSPTGKGSVYLEANDAPKTSPDWNNTNQNLTYSSTVHFTNISSVSKGYTLYAKANNGYDFKGWGTSSGQTTGLSSGSGDNHAFSVTITSNNNWEWSGRNWRYECIQNYYAIFSPTKYYITYDANGGSVSPSTSQEYTIESAGTLRTPTRAGYTFNGWEVTETAGSWPATGETVTEPSLTGKYGSVKLKAKWTPAPYTISFSANGGTGTGPSSIPYNVESTDITLPSCPYTKDGYKFAGWKPAANVGNWTTGESFAAQSTLPTGKYGNVTLAAQWEEVHYADITISASGLDQGDTALFTVSAGGEVLYTVPLTGDATGAASVTIKGLETGVQYTVQPVSAWTWAYSSCSPTNYIENLGASGLNASFAFTKNTSAKKHDEKSNANWKP